MCEAVQHRERDSGSGIKVEFKARRKIKYSLHIILDCIHQLQVTRNPISRWERTCAFQRCHAVLKDSASLSRLSLERGAWFCAQSCRISKHKEGAGVCGKMGNFLRGPKSSSSLPKLDPVPTSLSCDGALGSNI